MLWQLLVLFGFFALVLVSVYWINRAVGLFDQLIGDGQSALVFLEFTALALPNVIRLVLPIAAFAATIYVTNRLSTESELVVVQAMGYSSARLSRAVIMFGLIVGLMIAILVHLLVPISRSQLIQRQSELAENVTAQLLNAGRFLHPAEGITFYIRDITASGELVDIYLSDARTTGRRSTYTAKRAFLVAGDNGPKLLMFDGMAQVLTNATSHLAVTRFEESVFDVAGLIGTPTSQRRKIGELFTSELLAADPDLLAATKQSRAAFLHEGHSRLVEPLRATTAAILGFATLMMGQFSRFGIWRQILAAIGLLVVVKLAENYVSGIALKSETAWPLLYLPAVVGFATAMGMLWFHDQPRRRSRRRHEVAA